MGKTRSKPLQSFAPGTLKRSAINLFPLNPRSIDRHAKKRLRDNLSRNGLVEPLVVNRHLSAHGHPPEDEGRFTLVSGHQRLSCADDLYGYPDNDYDVPVAIVEVSPAKEMALVVSLNNPTMAGSWDHDILEQVAIAIASDPSGDIRDTGFERADLGILFDEGVLDEIFGVDPQVAAQVEAQAPTLEMLEEIRQAGKGARAGSDGKASRGSGDADRPPDEGGDDTTDDPAGDGDAVDPSDPPDSEAAAGDSAELARMKRERTAYRERVAEQNESEFMLVLVAENERQLERWMLHYRLPREKRYLSLGEFCSKTGLECEE